MSNRFKMRDGAAPGRRAIRTRDVAEKTRVAVYSGAHYVAEREGEDLIIYSIGDEGVPGVRTGDKRANDALKKIRDGMTPINNANKAASDFWDGQRRAQEAAK